MGEDMEFMPTPQLAARIFAIAERRAKLHGRTLGDGAAEYLRDHADKAARAIERNDAALDDVRQAFEKLIDEMVKAVDQIPGYAEDNPNLIGERTLSFALSRLCPLFPFC